RILFIDSSPHWKSHCGRRAAFWTVENLQLSTFAEESCQPGPSIDQPNAGIGNRMVSRSVILHAQQQAVTVFARRNFNHTGLAVFGDAVTDGILDQRLKNELRHQHVAELWIDGPLDPKAVRKSHLLDRQILLNKLQLGIQRYVLPVSALKHLAQHATKQLEHASRIARILVAHHDGDRIKTVEEKVRVELHAQRPQPGLGKLRGEFGLLRFALTRLAIIGESVDTTEHSEVQENSPRKIHQHPVEIISRESFLGRTS